MSDLDLFDDEPEPGPAGADEDAPPLIDPNQESLFASDELTTWGEEWKGMPAFDQKNLEPWKSVIVHFASSADMIAFGKLVEQRITEKTQSIWYPEAEIGRFADKRYADVSEGATGGIA